MAGSLGHALIILKTIYPTPGNVSSWELHLITLKDLPQLKKWNNEYKTFNAKMTNNQHNCQER